MFPEPTSIRATARQPLRARWEVEFWTEEFFFSQGRAENTQACWSKGRWRVSWKSCCCVFFIKSSNIFGIMAVKGWRRWPFLTAQPHRLSMRRWIIHWTLHRWEDMATFQLFASCSSPSMALAEFSPVCRLLAAARGNSELSGKSGALIRADESLARRNQQGPDAACVGFMRFIYVVSTWKRAHERGSERGPVRFLYRQSAELLTRRDAAVPEAGESLWW